MSFKKKLMALGIALVFSVAAAAPAFAETLDQFWLDYPNLTLYDSNYSYVLNRGGGQDVAVQAIDGSWMAPTLFQESGLADAISWSVIPAASGVSVVDNGHDGDADIYGGFWAPARIGVSGTAAYGAYIVEAENPAENTIDFAVAVNPPEPQTNVSANVRIYNGGLGSSYLAKSSSDVSVAYNNIATTIKYPSALDALAAVANVSSYTYGGSVYVNSVTFTPNNSDTAMTLPDLTNPISNYYWTYCVYDSAGNRVDLSYNIGAEMYDIDSNCTVVWVYGGWVDYPSTLAEIL